MLPKIPDEIYNNRCRYCTHFCKEAENRDFKSEECYRYDVKKPCQIQEIASYKYQVRHDDGTFRGSYEYIVYKDGECRSFAPLLSYPGICRSCAHYNSFFRDFCNKADKKKNYRQAVIGNTYGGEAYESGYFTCDNWVISERAKGYIAQDLPRERVPLIFDPKTYKLLTPLEISEKNAEWAKIQVDLVAKRKTAEEEERRKKLNLAPGEPEQLSMDI